MNTKGSFSIWSSQRLNRISKSMNSRRLRPFLLATTSLFFIALLTCLSQAEIRVRTPKTDGATKSSHTLRIVKKCISKCRRVPNRRACKDRCRKRLMTKIKSKECCKIPAVRCLACQAKVSIADYCAQRPETSGCAPPEKEKPDCCKDEFATCLACQKGTTINVICRDNPKLPGCSGAINHPCCREAKAQCVACNLGITVAYFCKDHPDAEGCPKKTSPSVEPSPDKSKYIVK